MESDSGESRTNSRKTVPWFWLALVLQSATFAALAWTAVTAPTPIWRLVALAIAAHVPYLAALYWAAKSPLRSVWTLLPICLALRLILVFAPPVFSDDVYRYVWDGRVLVSGTNPYRFSPDSAELAQLRDENWKKINHPSLRTIYPPAAQIVFGATSLVCPRPLAFKLLSGLADVGVVCLVILLAGGRFRHKAMPDQRQSKALWAGLVYGICPLPCIETAMSGHLEPVAVLLTLLALRFATLKRGVISAALLGLGTGVKLLPILAAPAIARKSRLVWIVVPAVLVALYLPFHSAGIGLASTTDTFVRRWEANAGLFAATKTAAQATIGAIAGVSDLDAMVHVAPLDPVAGALQNTFFSLHKDGGYDPAAPGAFALRDLSLALTKLVLGLFLVAVVVYVWLKKMDPPRAAAWVLGAFLIASPVVHPWYLLWVLGLAAALDLWPWFVLAATAPLAYLPLDDWWTYQIWEVPCWIPCVEYGAFLLAGAAYLVFDRGRKQNQKNNHNKKVKAGLQIPKRR